MESSSFFHLSQEIWKTQRGWKKNSYQKKCMEKMHVTWENKIKKILLKKKKKDSSH
jgi:hypothetical protein